MAIKITKDGKWPEPDLRLFEDHDIIALTKLFDNVYETEQLPKYHCYQSK